MEPCAISLRVNLPECINKSEFLRCNLNPVVVLTDIRKLPKETPPCRPSSEKNDEPKKEDADAQKVSKESLTRKEISRTTPRVSNATLCNPKRFKSMKRRRESWDPSVEYEIEKILGYHRDKKNRMKYLIKWKNWSSEHNTLEPIRNLTGCHYELMRYFEVIEPTKEEIMRKDLELEVGLVRRGVYGRLKTGAYRAEDLEELSERCPQARRLLETADLEGLERRIAEEYEYIVRCLIGMNSHQDPGLVGRGEDYRLLLQLIQLRRKQLQSNAFYETRINTLEKTKIAIENTIDFEEFPNINYIVDLKPGTGVVLPRDPLLGCECPEGCNLKSRCCGKMADSEFAYGSNGRLRTSQKIAIYECNSRCSCPPSCPNRVVQRGRQVKLCIFKTRYCGWGVKALEKISKGSFVCEYTGELITEEEANARDAKCATENKSSYLFNLDFFTDNRLPMYCIDATKHGNVARFINHSCDPNLVVYPVWVDGLEPNLHRLAFFARRSIQKNEEIQFDYENLGELSTEGPEDVTATDRLKCQCNAANCRKWVFRSS